MSLPGLSKRLLVKHVKGVLLRLPRWWNRRPWRRLRKGWTWVSVPWSIDMVVFSLRVHSMIPEAFSNLIMLFVGVIQHSPVQAGETDKEENMTVTEDFSRVENTYQMEAEVCIIFSDFGKMQNVCNLLIEKLGTSVTINPPHFYHTPEAIDTLRRQVCVTAVGNTRRKAQEVCQLFGQALGKPLLIKEEETKEWGGHIDSHLSHSADSQTLQERIQNATAYASCRVFAAFEIKGKENRRSKLP
ncbi:interleukin-1 receptor-associated kinase 1-binding protein 1 [Geospiza fortis]|uniref:Interleukin-1 receptor-associated kinase 1-binding protein 1 n=1 Tax=Geospiza fortis TaxID=48883 RepID=A0A6I9HHF6_GEOFO|nr:interleukin-1 receptor-associated kinase 1-binding protein 1 [Geospiza fortis]